MSTCDFVTDENPVPCLEIMCDTSTGSINENDSKTVKNDSESEENCFSYSENISQFNENVPKSDPNIAISGIENNESSSCSIDPNPSSFTNSPLVLRVLPVNRVKEEYQTQSKSNERPFSCDICDKTFKRRNHYNLHLFTHKTEKPYKCKLCDKAFTHHYFLKCHEPIHNTEKLFTCEFCDKKFSVRRYYTRHIRHHTKRRYECDVCDFVCHRLKESNTHVKSHECQLYRCNECYRLFCQELTLNLHLCFEADKRRFCCKMCPKTFRKIADLSDHEAIHENKKLFVCDTCNAGFNTKTRLNYHIQSIHEEETEIKPYSCQVCERKFHLETNLKRHEKNHQNERSEVNQNEKSEVNQDKKSFPVTTERKSSVNRKKAGVVVGYINIEHPVPKQAPVYFVQGKNIKYVCNICLRGFKHRTSLTTHLRRHSGDKPFKCDDCSWRFADKSDLKRHSRIHNTTDDQKYSCNCCCKTFTRKTYLNAHCRKCGCCSRLKLPKITSVVSLDQE